MKLNDVFKNEQYGEAYAFAEENNYLLKHIGQSEDGENLYQIVERNFEEETKILLENEVLNLKHWFDTEYRYKNEKYVRLIALNTPDNDGVSAEIKIMELYKIAEEKRKRIQEIEEIIKQKGDVL